MTEYIVELPDKPAKVVRDGWNVRIEWQYKQREPIVRCRDCKFGVDGGKYCAEGCADSWDWRNVEPDGFCAWGERREP